MPGWKFWGNEDKSSGGGESQGGNQEGADFNTIKNEILDLGNICSIMQAKKSRKHAEQIIELSYGIEAKIQSFYKTPGNEENARSLMSSLQIYIDLAAKMIRELDERRS